MGGQPRKGLVHVKITPFPLPLLSFLFDTVWSFKGKLWLIWDFSLISLFKFPKDRWGGKIARKWYILRSVITGSHYLLVVFFFERGWKSVGVSWRGRCQRWYDWSWKNPPLGWKASFWIILPCVKTTGTKLTFLIPAQRWLLCHLNKIQPFIVSPKDSAGLPFVSTQRDMLI